MTQPSLPCAYCSEPVALVPENLHDGIYNCSKRCGDQVRLTNGWTSWTVDEYGVASPSTASALAEWMQPRMGAGLNGASTISGIANILGQRISFQIDGAIVRVRMPPNPGRDDVERVAYLRESLPVTMRVEIDGNPYRSAASNE